MIKKCYLKLYLNNNLGDDLFAKIIAERYPNIEFITFSHKKVKLKIKNLKIISGILFKIINKLLKLFTNSRITIDKILINRSSITILLGGSMFIEGESGEYQELKGVNNYYIIGTNFGPHKTDLYLNKIKDIVKASKYTCFRDTKSYNLFEKECENTNVAPDIIFGLDVSNVNITNNKKVIISIIDCSTKIGPEYEEKYEQKIIELTEYFIDNKYDITYMSFCKNENDELAIERIISRLDEKKAQKVSTYYYNGNIQEALNILGDSQIIVGSRFHANILGLILNKTIIPIIYSEKTANVLSDINFKGKIIDIKEIEKFNINDIVDEDLYYRLDVSNLKKESQKHFLRIDEVLE